MSDNQNEKNFSDDQLGAFLKKYQPEPPPARMDLLASLRVRLGFEAGVQRRARTTWFAFAGALAAMVVAVLISRAPEPSPSAESVQLEEELYDEELPALDVGADYFDMVAANVN